MTPTRQGSPKTNLDFGYIIRVKRSANQLRRIPPKGIAPLPENSFLINYKNKRCSKCNEEHSISYPELELLDFERMCYVLITITELSQAI